MKTDNISVILLHEHLEYLDPCAALLNSQWKRSFSARIQSLDKSCQDLPDSLLLLEEENGEKRLIGHSRLTRVLEDYNGCWIESVVIAEEKRNKGYGKYLMMKTEEYAKQLNFLTAYLNTQDQQGFYEHLGYVYGEVVSPINFQRNAMVKNLMFSLVKSNVENETHFKSGQGEKAIKMETNVSQPVPPPPPMPKNNNVNRTAIKSNLGKYWMKKSL